MRILNTDALVVLCLKDQEDSMTVHEFRVRANLRGLDISKAQSHNMMHRAVGRVGCTLNNKWRLTAMGLAYRQEVLQLLQTLLTTEGWVAISKSA